MEYKVKEAHYPYAENTYTKVTPETWDKHGELTREILLTKEGMIFVVRSDMLPAQQTVRQNIQSMLE